MNKSIQDFYGAEALTLLRGMEASLPEIQDPEQTGVARVANSSDDARLTKARKYQQRGQKRNLKAVTQSGSAARKSFEGSIGGEKG